MYAGHKDVFLCHIFFLSGPSRALAWRHAANLGSSQLSVRSSWRFPQVDRQGRTYGVTALVHSSRDPVHFAAVSPLNGRINTFVVSSTDMAKKELRSRLSADSLVLSVESRRLAHRDISQRLYCGPLVSHYSALN